MRKVKPNGTGSNLATKRVPLSSHACGKAWRRFTAAKRFSFYERVPKQVATRSFSSARTAIAATAIAVPNAVDKLAAGSGAKRTSGTNSARRGGSIIGIDNASTAVETVKRAPA